MCFKEHEGLMRTNCDDTFKFIPSISVPEKLHAHERQHYNREMYYGAVRIVWSLV